MAADAPASRQPRDFASYGNLEAFSAVLIPALVTYFGWPGDRAEALLLVIANVALMIGLIVGAKYWWAVAARLTRRTEKMARALRLADVAQTPMLLLTLAAIMGCAWQAADHGMTLTNIFAIVVTALAALEYINYYHVQLQHFDNMADL